MTYNGTLRQNKAYLPTEFRPNRQREVHSSVFGFTDTTTIVSYVPKQGRAVTLMSTLHKDAEITDIQRKPKMIVDYNKSKGGVDTLDQLVRSYSSKRKTNRWPFAIFCILLDICCYNAFIIFLHANPDFQNGKSHKRRLFILEMTKCLLPSRENEPRIQLVSAPSEHKYTRCKFCPRQKDKKTKERCVSCEIPICKEHTVTICANCHLSTA